MQIEINTGKCELLLVKVPEGVKVHHVNTLWHNDKITGNPIHIDLLQGNWTLIGNAFELTEEQCKGVVNNSYRYPDLNKWIDYTSESTRYVYLLGTAIKSFASLLLANNIHKTNPLQSEWDEACTWGHGGCTMDEYKKAGERTGNWVVLRKEPTSC